MARKFKVRYNPTRITGILHEDQYTFLYVIKTNKMQTFYTKVLIQLQCLRHVSNIQVFILRKAFTCSFMVFLSSIHINSLVDGRMCLILTTQVYHKARFKIVKLISDHISSSSSQNWKCFRQICGENQDTRFKLNKFLSKIIPYKQ